MIQPQSESRVVLDIVTSHSWLMILENDIKFLADNVAIYQITDDYSALCYVARTLLDRLIVSFHYIKVKVINHVPWTYDICCLLR